MKHDLGAALAVSVAAFLVYIATLCPTVWTGDSGELAVAATTLGLAHPPGFPLWTILGRLAVLALPGTPAYSLNLFSALSAALAAGLLTLVLTTWTGRVVASAAAGLAFALSRAVWANAVTVEVYSLNLLVTVAAIFAASRARRGRPLLFLLAAYLVGLGAANHPFALLAGPVVLALATMPRSAAHGETPEPTGPERFARLLPMAGLFALGLSMYAYLPVRWSAGPAMNWGGIRDFSEVVDHVMRTQYGGLGEAGAKTSFALRLRVFLIVLQESAPILVLAGAALGLVGLVRRRAVAGAVALGGFLLFSGPLTAAAIRYEDTFLDRSVVTVYFLPAVLATYLLFGVGLAALEDAFARLAPARAGVARAAFAALALATPIAFFFLHRADCDRSKSTMARVYAEAAIGPLPPGSRFYAMGDNECFGTYYFHEVEKLRPDVVFMDRTLNIVVDRYGEDFANLSRVERKGFQVAREAELAFAERGTPVFYSDMADVAEFGGCRVEPNGVVYQLLRAGEAPADLAHEPIVAPPNDPSDYLETHLTASTLYREGAAFARIGKLEEARASFAESARRAGPIAAVHRNLGLAALDLGDVETAEREFLRALEIEPANEDALYNSATLYAMTGRVDESLARFEPLVQAGSPFAEVWLGYGVQLVQAGRLEEAGAAAERALQLEPDLDPAKTLQGAVKEGLSLGGEAGILEAKRKIEPVTVGGTLQLAQRYLDRGEVVRATDLYREALKSAPADVGAAYGLGYGLLKIGRLDEAARAFRSVLSADPKSANGRNALAFIFAERGESLAVAERLATEAIDLAPALSPYWHDTLGWVRHRRGRHVEALESLRLAEKELPLDDPGARAENQFHLGSVLAAMGKTQDARAAIEQCLPRAKGERWESDARALGKKLGLVEGEGV